MTTTPSDEFNVIQHEELPNGCHLITLTKPDISGHWIVLASPDALSDRVIAPSGRFAQIGPVGNIPAELWYACERVLR